MVPTREKLHLLLNKQVPGGIGAEIGVRFGLYSAYLLKNWSARKLYSIDPWAFQAEGYRDKNNRDQNDHERAYERAVRTLAPFGERSEIIRAFGEEAAARFAEESLDFVYIDARHDYVSVREDIARWLPKVRPGGILAGHDFVAEDFCAHTEFGVKRAVLERFEAKELIVTAGDKFPSWIWIKRPVAAPA